MSATVLPEARGAHSASPIGARLRAAFADKPEVACAILITAGIDATAAAAGWWHLAGTPEPRFLLIWRAAAFCLAVVNLISLFDLKRRPRLLYLSAIVGIAGPLLLLLMFATIDGGDMAAAIIQQEQCSHLIADTNHVNFAVGTAWYAHRIVIPVLVPRDDYNVLDGLETAAFFTKSGYYLAIAGGLLSLLCLWAWDGAAARREIVASRGWLIVFGVLLAVDFGRLALGFAYWNIAHKDATQGDYRQALRDDRTASFWDPRLKFDLVESYDLGRLDGALGERNTADYWAMVGDTRLVTGDGDPKQGYMTYRLHVLDPGSFELKTRYGNAAYEYGASVFERTPETALSIWRDGYAVDPQNLETLYALALGETKVRSYDEAIVHWRLLLGEIDGIGIYQSKFAASTTYLRPISSHAWSALAWCYFNRKDYDAANRCVYNATLPSAASLDTVPARENAHGN